jgi:spore photoproduct lyase
LDDFDLATWFEEVYIHDAAWESNVSRRVRSILKTQAIRVDEKPFSENGGQLSAKEFDHSKKRLYVAPHQGHFFRKCPGTQGAACCNYFVLNLGSQCNMNCTYCYLQSYINSPMTQIYSNIDDALLELDNLILKNPQSAFRVGTGETIDSLSLDDLTHYSVRLVEWFSRHPKLTCEFKTKSDNISNFLNLNHVGNVVVSFSINPEEIISKFEFRTASLKRRLAAARASADQGFPVAFHIDPMIYVENWRVLYSDLVDEIVDLFETHEIKWISVGALRFQPAMKDMMRERFGVHAPSTTGELFLSSDGKLRYDQRLRSEMFNSVITRFKKADPRYPVFLCMETPETWLNTFEATPRQVQNIEDLFLPQAFKETGIHTR